MKKIYNKIILFTAAIMVVTSCDFGDTNVDPSVPTDVSMSALLPSGQTAISWAIGGEMVRISGLLTQQFEGINAQQQDNYKYLIRDADMDGVWQRMYHNSLNTVNILIEKAQDQNAPHYEGVGLVLMATGLGTLTDAFGDIPYTDAFQGDEDNFAPQYDTQEEIYTTIIPGLLDEAIQKLSAAESLGGSPGGEDLIFGGDLDKWILAANSLKVRYAFQLAKRDAGAYDEALNLMSGIITSNSDDFEMYFGTGANEPNPQYQFSQSRAGNIKMGEFFVNAFTDSDTRMEELVNSVFELGRGADGFYTVSEAPVVLMSYAELKFIEAEAQLMKAASDEVAAKQALDEAVEASFNKITGEGVPADYQDELDSTWAASTDKLEVLINEKYIAMYSQSIIVWNDYRRTGYPELDFVDGGTNAFNTNGEIPRRLPYPQEERLLNLENLPIKTPNLQTPVWWDE